MRRAGSIAAIVLVAATAVACRPPSPWRPGHGNGYLPSTTWDARQGAYLQFATESLDRGSPANIYAHLARSERDRRFRFDARSIRPADLQATFDKIDAHRTGWEMGLRLKAQDLYDIIGASMPDEGDEVLQHPQFAQQAAMGGAQQGPPPGFVPSGKTDYQVLMEQLGSRVALNGGGVV